MMLANARPIVFYGIMKLRRHRKLRTGLEDRESEKIDSYATMYI